MQVSSDVSCITSKKLGNNSQKMFQDICQRWGIPYHNNMLQWSLRFGQNTTFSDEAWQLIKENPIIQKSVEELREQTTFNYHPLKQEKLNITLDERDKINQQLVPLYQEVSKLAEAYYPN